MKEIALWIVKAVADLGYLGIFFLMFLESSFFPFPSEVVMPPAGYLASKGEMSLSLAIIFGSLGSLMGALFNYLLSLKLGRPFLLRYGKYFLLTESKLKKVDVFFENHGAISMFLGRLLPGIRQYISLPAGIAKMNIFTFCTYTLLGASIWVSILSFLGYFVGHNEELLKKHLHLVSFVLMAFCLFALVIYIFVKKRKLKFIV